ncbi:MAG: acyl-[acyl carrier protein]--UDP-N-acetylglucosamine O-acyltransferase [Flavobacteriales bacterium]|jgi:acyl-[acyl carrier protein]--UDP-N-acetylglucosamine O-acyltransferase
MNNQIIKISDIASLLKIDYYGIDSDIDGLNLCNRDIIADSVVSYIASDKFISNGISNAKIRGLFVTKAVYEIIVKKEGFKSDIAFFIVDYPEIEFYKLHEILYSVTSFYKKFNFESVLGQNCIIHPTSVIEEGVIIGNNVRIGANSVIKKGTIINDDSAVGSCTVIGAEGFQLIYNEYNVPFTVTHVGGTYIGKNVLINDNCTISNALFEGNVIIGDNCKIDSQVHIGHNCKIGKNSVITGNSLLMGTVELKESVWIAPSATISNKCIVHSNSFVGSMSLVANNISENSRVCGIPAIPVDEYIKMIIQQKKLIKNGRKNSNDSK